jgi:hypothetical protein
MNKVHAVLLAPKEGSDLLAEGPCGAKPPMAHFYQEAWKPGLHPWSIPHALVLAWEGEVVTEGMDRLYRCLGANPEARTVWPSPHTILQAYNAYRGSQPHPWGGTLICIDAEGKEVTDE